MTSIANLSLPVETSNTFFLPEKEKIFNTKAMVFCKRSAAVVKKLTNYEHLALIQWRSQPKNFWGSQMFDFRRITLFCFEKCLSKHKMTIFSVNFLRGMAPLSPPGYAYALSKTKEQTQVASGLH